MASNFSQISTIGQQAEDQGRPPNWFVKAYILRGQNDRYAEFYDRNIEHIKFFVKHVRSDIDHEDRIVDDPDESTIKNDMEALAKEAQQNLEKFQYTHVMLIFSVYGNVEKFNCREKELHFKEIQSIMDRSEILKSKLKVVIIDAFGGNEQVQALSPKKTTSGAVSKLPDGINLLKYDGMFKNYDGNIFGNGSLFLRVVFHELLTQSYENRAIDLNEVFQACKRIISSDNYSKLVEYRFNQISDSTTQVPVITLHLGDTTPDDINNQYPLTFNV